MTSVTLLSDAHEAHELQRAIHALAHATLQWKRERTAEAKRRLRQRRAKVETLLQRLGSQ